MSNYNFSHQAKLEPETEHTCGQERRLTQRKLRRLANNPECAESINFESPEGHRWTQFESLEFSGDEPLPSSNPDLLAHAKIYVFATRYLIDAWREQSLKSLHRDLCTFQFT